MFNKKNALFIGLVLLFGLFLVAVDQTRFLWVLAGLGLFYCIVRASDKIMKWIHGVSRRERKRPEVVIFHKPILSRLLFLRSVEKHLKGAKRITKMEDFED